MSCRYLKHVENGQPLHAGSLYRAPVHRFPKPAERFKLVPIWYLIASTSKAAETPGLAGHGFPAHLVREPIAWRRHPNAEAK